LLLGKFLKMKKENNSMDRMKQLVKSFEQKNEILKENSENLVDESAILKEADRLKQIARVDEWIDNNKNTPIHGGVGATVNTFIPNTLPTNQNQPGAINKTYNPNYTYLQPNEALQLCIRRALESGAPVNNLGFYEEINWNLNNMGFNARMPIDIKDAVKKMISGE